MLDLHSTRVRRHLYQYLAFGLILPLCSTPAFADQIQQQALSDLNSSEPRKTSSLAYVSDFFSFVGRDAVGHVAFALDNNRGQDGDTWQTEHLLILLHDEQKGWQKLEGAGPYENTKKTVLQIPNSSYVEFTGDLATGLTIKHLESQLTLQVQGLHKHVLRREGDSRYQMGSAAATMTWQGRTLTGWVIHEHLEMVDFNRLTHQYFDLWTESYGLYAWMENSSDFLTVHQQAEHTPLTPLIGNSVGFTETNHIGEPLQDLQLTVKDSTQAMGFYQWPQGWKGQWTGQHGSGSLDVQISDLQVISNFILGGLAMGIIQGNITYKGQTRKIYGMAELLL